MPSAIIEANKRTRVRKKGGDVMRATKVDEPDEQKEFSDKDLESIALLIFEIISVREDL